MSYQQPPNTGQWQPQQPFPPQQPSNPNNPPYQQQPWPQQQPHTSYPPHPEWQPQQQPNPNYQQYPQQPMPPQQQPPQKKKSRALLWIVLGVVGVLVLGCIGTVAAITTAARNTSTATFSTLATSIATTNTTPSTSGQVGKVGQTITVQDIATTLVSVKPLAADEFTKPKPGNEFIVVHIKMVNHSTGEISYNPFDFHVRSGSGNITDEEFAPLQTYTANNELQSGKLSSGGNVEGDMIFQVGKSDHKAQLTWQPSFFGNAGDNGWLLGI
jgi:hypothetical protein